MTKRGTITCFIIAAMILVIEPITRKGLKAYIEDVAFWCGMIGAIYFVKWWFLG